MIDVLAVLGALAFLQCGTSARPLQGCAGRPYLPGTEGYDSDGVIPPGEHELVIRAKDGGGWLEQTFQITGAG